MQRVSTPSAATVLPAPTPGGAPGYFAKPDPANDIAATVPGHDWFNTVQEEICNVITGAGLALDAQKRDQLLQAMRSSGLFPTPPQFDNTQKVATTEFVQRALGNFSGVSGVIANTPLPAAGAGRVIGVGGGGTKIITLPPADSVLSGACFTISADVFTTVNIQSADGENLAFGGGLNTVFVLGSGETVFAYRSGPNWALFGTAVLKYSSAFSSSLTSNGYQKLPSGLIIQWGQGISAANGAVTVTFPIAFPTACRSAVASNAATTSPSAGAYFGCGSFSPAGMGVWAQNQTAGMYFYWIAIGN